MKKGKPIGTLSRFAGHPDVAVLFELRGVNDQYKFNFDWPGYLSEKLERDLGGTSIYLNGPCADLTVKKGFDGMDTYEVCAAEARRIGEDCRTAGSAAALPGRCRSEIPPGFKADTFHLEMPMREKFSSPVTIFPTGSRSGGSGAAAAAGYC